MFIFTELSNILRGVRKRHSRFFCCDHMFDHCESQTEAKRKMSILNYFKRKEILSECLERIDKNNETSSSLQLTSTEVEYVVTEFEKCRNKGWMILHPPLFLKN